MPMLMFPDYYSQQGPSQPQPPQPPIPHRACGMTSIVSQILVADSLIR